MVRKKSRSESSREETQRMRNRFSRNCMRDRVWQCSEVIIICMLRLFDDSVGQYLW